VGFFTLLALRKKRNVERLRPDLPVEKWSIEIFISSHYDKNLDGNWPILLPQWKKQSKNQS
jgi:hypothetical protein